MKIAQVTVALAVGIVATVAAFAVFSPRTEAAPAPAVQAPTTNAVQSQRSREDLIFLATVEAFQVPGYDHPDGMIKFGKELCHEFDEGYSFEAIGTALVASRVEPIYDAEDAGHLLGAATAAYCPQYRVDS